MRRIDDLRSYVLDRSTPEPNTGCWLWTGRLTPGGYGAAGVAGFKLAHRLSYVTFRAPPTDGNHLDHLCRQRSCVNPWHLEDVTPSVNAQRGLQGFRAPTCGKGHEFTPQNTRLAYGRERMCITCARIRYWGGKYPTLRVPRTIADLLLAEANRRLVSPQEVALEVLEAWARAQR